jgi:hypothetical protein
VEKFFVISIDFFSVYFILNLVNVSREAYGEKNFGTFKSILSFNFLLSHIQRIQNHENCSLFDGSNVMRKLESYMYIFHAIINEKNKLKLDEHQ